MQADERLTAAEAVEQAAVAGSRAIDQLLEQLAFAIAEFRAASMPHNAALARVAFELDRESGQSGEGPFDAILQKLLGPRPLS